MKIPFQGNQRVLPQGGNLTNINLASQSPMAGVMNGVASVTNSIYQAQQQTALANADTEASRQIDQLTSSFSSRTDYSQFDVEYNQKSDEIFNNLSKDMSGPSLRVFKNSFENLRLTKGVAVTRLAATGQVDVSKSSLFRNLNTIRDLASSSSPAQRETLLNKGKLLIQEGVNNAYVSALDGAKQEADFISDVAITTVKKDILSDPEAALDNLLQDKYSDLTEEDKTSLTKTAQTQAEAKTKERVRVYEKQEKAADKATKKRQTEKTSDFLSRILVSNDPSETPTEGEILEAHRKREIKDSQLTPLLNALDEKPFNEDPSHALFLQYKALSGDLTADEVALELSNGSIEPSTSESLLKTVNSTEKSGGVLGTAEFKNELPYIKALTGGIRGPLAVLDPESSKREASAIREFQDRVLDIGEVDSRDESIRQIADDIVKKYATPNSSAKEQTGYLVGTPEAPDFQASFNAIVKAFNSKQLTAAQRDREMSLLEATKLEYEAKLTRDSLRGSR